MRDAAPLSPTAPSPLAGEGSSVLPRVMMGEGLASQKVFTKKPPHPSGFVAAPLRPLPQGARARAAPALLAATSPDRPRAFHLTMSNSQSSHDVKQPKLRRPLTIRARAPRSLFSFP